MANNDNEDRGLASASRETRQRVARMGGEASGKARRQKKSESSNSNKEER
jgi:hypothetical protein